jgi:eukaryotic-like serine/threonine-protein kinase
LVSAWVRVVTPLPSSTSSVPVLMASTVVPNVAYIQVRVAVNPVGAKVLLDGAPLPMNPFEGKFLKDGAVHRIQIEDIGFLPQSRFVVFNKDISIETVLQPRPKPKFIGNSVLAPPTRTTKPTR